VVRENLIAVPFEGVVCNEPSVVGTASKSALQELWGLARKEMAIRD
jgi:hypothetical protein